MSSCRLVELYRGHHVASSGSQTEIAAVQLNIKLPYCHCREREAVKLLKIRFLHGRNQVIKISPVKQYLKLLEVIGTSILGTVKITIITTVNILVVVSLLVLLLQDYLKE